jgi:hypothetical protein
MAMIPHGDLQARRLSEGFAPPAALVALLLLSPAAATADCPESPDVDDFTEYTYVVSAGPIGTFADRLVERTFEQSISEICVTIVSGDADDIGYVGGLQVTDAPPRCARVGRVQAPVDVTSEVTVDGDTASLLLRAQENCCCVTGWGSATQGDRLNARLHWQVSLGGPQVVAGLGNSPSDPGTEKKPAEDGLTATFPLGSVFFLQLEDEDEEPIESRFSLATATVSPTDGPTLFGNHAVIEFDAATADEVKFFQAVHLGEVTVTIEPTDTSISPVEVLLRVVEPARLGNTANGFDVQFVDFGHRRGIPPQILKGLARREAGPNLNPEAYRYEPIAGVGDLNVISAGQNLRTQLPYSRYRLATADGLAAGADLLDADVSPRSVYFIRRVGQLRPIADTDQFVSALEIFEQNDSFLGVKDPSVRDQRWSAFAAQRVLNSIRRDHDVLDFTAQTPLAASYGVMQVLYTTAIAPMGWTGLKPAGACRTNADECNPSGLFDTAANIADGGGTVALASDYLRRGFARQNPGVSQTDPRFGNRNQLEAAYRNMIRTYNQRQAYPNEVINFSRGFAPVAASPIFGAASPPPGDPGEPGEL